jgi:hypothetical protein
MPSAMNVPAGKAGPAALPRPVPRRQTQPAQPETGPPAIAHATQKMT